MTFTVYVCLVMLSAAVTTMVIVFAPTIKGMLADADPEVVAVPFTAMVAVGSATVGVTVMEVMELPVPAV